MTTINGTTDDDVLVGTISGDSIYGNTGNDTLYGGGGYSNYLYGETGNDTYVFVPNGAQQVDYIYEDPTAGENTLKIEAGESAIQLVRSGDNLYVYFNDATSSLIYVPNQFLNEATGQYRVGTLQLNDVTIDLTGGLTFRGSGTGTIHDDTMLGTTANNESIFGNAGNDTLYGGGGYNNYLYGEAGNDTYVFVPNGAQQVDYIYEDPTTDSNKLKIDANQADVSLVRSGNNLYAYINDGTSSFIYIPNQFLSEADNLFPISSIYFKDGGVVHYKQLRDFSIEQVVAPASFSLLPTVQIGFDLKNTGSEAIFETAEAMLYLSRDTALGADDTLLATRSVDFSVGFQPGATQPLLFELPSSITQGLDFGNYRFIVKTTLPGAVADDGALEQAAVSAAVLHEPAYHATISAPDGIFAAGNGIALNGVALSTGDGLPVAFVLVTIEVARGAFSQTYATITDALGQFSFNYASLDQAAGTFTVNAHHPAFAAEDGAAEDSFDVVDVNIDQSQITRQINGGGITTGNFTVRNLSNVPVHGLTFDLSAMPADWQLTFDNLPDSLAAGETVSVQYNR